MVVSQPLVSVVVTCTLPPGSASTAVGSAFTAAPSHAELTVALTDADAPTPSAVIAAIVNVYRVPGCRPLITRIMTLAVGWPITASRPVSSNARPSETVTR